MLFRSSFHSFDLELELQRRDIPFIKRGGFKFIETAHIKDVLAHLRVIANPADAVSWLRALMLVNGVGHRTRRAPDRGNRRRAEPEQALIAIECGAGSAAGAGGADGLRAAGRLCWPRLRAESKRGPPTRSPRRSSTICR